MLQKFFGNLILDFALLLILALSIAIFSVFNIYKIDASYQKLVSHSFQIKYLANKIEISTLEMMLLENQLILNIDQDDFDQVVTNYIEPHQSHSHSLQQDLSDLEKIVQDSSSSNNVTIYQDILTIKNNLEDYEEDFDKLVQAIEKRGTLHSGLEGEFRTSANEIALTLEEEVVDKDIIIAALNMRLAEETFLLERTIEWANLTLTYAIQVEVAISESTLPSEKKAELALQLRNYQNDFRTFIIQDQQIYALHHELVSLGLNIQDLAKHINAIGEESATTDIGAASLTASEIVQNTVQLLLLTISVVIVAGTGVGITLYFQRQQKK